MTPTITKPLQQRLIYRTPEELNDWFNKQLLPFLGQVRQALTYVNRIQATYQTSGTGVATIWSSADVAVGQVIKLTAYVVGVEVNDRGALDIIGVFVNHAGTFAQEGATTAAYTNNPPGYVVSFLVVGNHVELQVVDAGNVTNWVAVVDCLEATAP